MNSQRIAVITDTGTDTPTAFAREHDVRIVPLRINFSDGSTFESGVTITPEQLVERMATEVPSTSLPSPATIRREFDRAHDDGYAAAVFVSISSGLSATCDTVRMLADQLDDFPVVVVDSKSIGVGAGLVVMEAVRMVEEGITLQYIGAMLELVARKNSVFFSVKSLEYLRKGGRISAAVYRLGSALNIKPVITCNEEGAYVVARKAPTRRSPSLRSRREGTTRCAWPFAARARATCSTSSRSACLPRWTTPWRSFARGFPPTFSCTPVRRSWGLRSRECRGDGPLTETRPSARK